MNDDCDPRAGDHPPMVVAELPTEVERTLLDLMKMIDRAELPAPMTYAELDALWWAHRQHGDQKHGEGRPYAAHLVEVYEVAVGFDLAPEIRLAALLHDTVEDTVVTTRILRDRFGADVALLVEAVTGRGVGRHERNVGAYRKIRSLGPRAVFLKLSDRIANVEAAKGGAGARYLKLYRREQADFIYAMRLAVHDVHREEVRDPDETPIAVRLREFELDLFARMCMRLDAALLPEDDA